MKEAILDREPLVNTAFVMEPSMLKRLDAVCARRGVRQRSYVIRNLVRAYVEEIEAELEADEKGGGGLMFGFLFSLCLALWLGLWILRARDWQREAPGIGLHALVIALFAPAPERKR